MLKELVIASHNKGKIAEFEKNVGAIWGKNLFGK